MTSFRLRTTPAFRHNVDDFDCWRPLHRPATILSVEQRPRRPADSSGVLPRPPVFMRQPGRLIDQLGGVGMTVGRPGDVELAR